MRESRAVSETIEDMAYDRGKLMTALPVACNPDPVQCRQPNGMKSALFSCHVVYKASCRLMKLHAEYIRYLYIIAIQSASGW